VVEQFMTDTAKVADIILPAKDMFEQSDIIGSYWSPYIQFKPKILQPEGEVVPESEIYYHLAKRLGLKISSDALPDPGNDNIEKWLETRIKGKGNPTLSDLRNGPVLAPGLQKIAYADLKFDTPSGKIELLSIQMEEKWNSYRLPAYSEPEREPEDIEKFPLAFISPNTGSRIHSQFGNLEVIRNTVDKPAVEISVRDAEKRKIISGDPVRIYNNSGSVKSFAKVTGRLPAGIVVLPNGIWLDENGGVNMLTLPGETDIGFGAAFHDNYVEIEKITE
jgi:anaerobic selenocysteine-containing dehydrogenase